MNELQMLQRYSGESVPVLREAVGKLRRLFPELRLRGNALERTPNADTFITTNIEKQATTGYTAMVHDHVNLPTQTVESRIETVLDTRLPKGDAFEREHFLKELDSNGRVVTQVNASTNGSIAAFEHEYGAGKEPIKTTWYHSTGKDVSQFDEKTGQEILHESIPTKEFADVVPKNTFITNPNGTRTHLVTYTRKTGEEEITTINKNKITQTLNGKQNGCIDIDPKTGKVSQITLKSKFGDDVILTFDYTGKRCQSLAIKDKSGNMKNFVEYDAVWDKNSPIIDEHGFLKLKPNRDWNASSSVIYDCDNSIISYFAQHVHGKY